MPVANYMIATPIGWAELDRAGAGAAAAAGVVPGLLARSMSRMMSA